MSAGARRRVKRVLPIVRDGVIRERRPETGPPWAGDLGADKAVSWGHEVFQGQGISSSWRPPGAGSAPFLHPPPARRTPLGIVFAVGVSVQRWFSRWLRRGLGTMTPSSSRQRANFSARCRLARKP